jgi:protein disulfide-isomerase
MKKTILALTVLFTITAFSQKATWLTDYNKAAKISKKSNKPILANFTGSDWCGWCKVLDKEVFSTPEFAKWAKKKVILLKVDFPRRTKLAPELQKQNYALQKAFGVRGYPTIWLFEPGKGDNPKKDIKPLGKTGYIRGGFEKWVATIEKYL